MDRRYERSSRYHIEITGTKKMLIEKNSNCGAAEFHENSSVSSYSDGGSFGFPSNPSSPSPEDGLETLLTMTDKKIFNVSDFGSEEEFIQSRIANLEETGSFLVTNLSPIIRQLNQWREELPMVEPFYAVKCNPDPITLQLLALLGCGFDCASQGEIDLVLHRLGAISTEQRALASTNIVYANPAKMESHLNFAIQHNVCMTVFDGEDELYKIASLPNHQSLQLLIRLATDDKNSICRFSNKFGCPVDEAPRLLEIAKSLNLNVIGVSFHVGSGCGDGNAYLTALDHTYRVFVEGERLGMPPMHLVDIGGGFPGDTGGYGGPGMPTFQELAAKVREGISCFCVKMKKPRTSFRFIAEPGRYFVSAATTVVTKVYSRKGGRNQYQALYVDDGVYGSFNNVVYDHATPAPKKLTSVLKQRLTQLPNVRTEIDAESETSEDVIPTAVFGPTCDGLDQMCALEDTLLERCEVGDWLLWANQGAYTHTASFVFNGFTHVPNRTYCF